MSRCAYCLRPLRRQLMGTEICDSCAGNHGAIDDYPDLDEQSKSPAIGEISANARELFRSRMRAGPLRYSNDWLRRRIASDPDDDPSAGNCEDISMSFSFEFHAKIEDVGSLLVTDGSAKIAPDHVKQFILAAINGLPAEIVHVKAHGHLYQPNSNSYQVSNCTVEVKPITVAKLNVA